MVLEIPCTDIELHFSRLKGMHVLSRIIFYSLLSFHLGWAISALETLHVHPEREPLLNRHRAIHNISDEALENETSRKFRMRIERITRKFKKIDSLSSHKKQKLLDQWQQEVRNLKIQEGLCKAGFHEGLKISEETLQKFEAIKTWYPPQKSNFCSIL